MSARLRQRFYAWGTIPLLLVACDPGVVELKPLAAAGASTSGSPARAGTGGSAGDLEDPRDPRAGAGGMPRMLWPSFCDEGSELEQEEERELREAFTEAYDSGSYCPNLSSGPRRSLMLDRELEWRARIAVCGSLESRPWRPIPRTPVWAWVLWGVSSLEEAKVALLTSDRTQLCEQAERTPFRNVGVGHLYDVWIVFLAPAPAEDMQKP